MQERQLRKKYTGVNAGTLPSRYGFFVQFALQDISMGVKACDYIRIEA